ncbi:serine/threonine-protein kinase [Singulisphaera acidiphila]|uniref:non-specific serine/threonine protein kinase n=1 Tax=Singulisphaera acidiphila (strain ATCC BAA-1392 / DSM 18658 / VKM B-2454 / MOB10) TaxID=886293 RepID=L0DBL9_SINAD|nr:serine/threonine-protein kinase [Singulisphaera acidiphila]AGA26250.1 protein kinase family protein [Singulisphaera acidiphila DSM 18658]
MSEPRSPHDRDQDVLESTEHETQLIALLQELTDELRQGLVPDVEKVARRHPELADELRDLWATARIAEELAAPLKETAAWSSSSRHGLSQKPTLLEPGTQRLGNHQLLEELGRGGMGVVYRALELEHGRIVALKCLLRGESAGANDLARFRAETAAAAKLAHPHIVPLHYVDEHEGQPYFVMTYIDGTTLAKRLADGPMTATEAAKLLVQVSRAVQHAHGQGVLHRDLKPSNILLDRDGEAYIGDFGLAKLIDVDGSLTQSGAILGTPSYMSPEQASRSWGPIGPASDVYSLGAILYQMLTGRPPFQAPSPLDTVLLLLEQDPVPPRLLNPKVNADLEMIALKCLQKAPNLRYPSAAALGDDLDAYLAGEPISARSTTLRALAARLLGETHHAAVLENWGMLWICHSVALVLFFGLTNGLLWRGVSARWPYVTIFTVGLGAWAALFWTLRRRGGPISFVERQLAHIWGAGVIGINLIFLVEWLLGLPVLTLAPMIAVMNGALFLVKGGILSGSYYVQAALTFLAIVPMARFPRFAPIIYGVVAGLCFFTTGLKYHLRYRRTRRLAENRL